MFADTIASVLADVLLKPAARAIHQDIAQILNEIPVDFGGGCSLSKAYLMAELIRRHGLTSTADIGVYRGRSLFPQALAHAMLTGGIVYGIDPYCQSEAREYDTEDSQRINDFVGRLDFESIYRGVAHLIEQRNLANHCVLLRHRSTDAISFFSDNGVFFDLIHIDGNHDSRVVVDDVEQYVPRLRRNGFVVVDDISWASVGPAYETLQSSLFLVFERRDRINDYAVFYNATSRLDAVHRRLVLQWISKFVEPSLRVVERSSAPKRDATDVALRGKST